MYEGVCCMRLCVVCVCVWYVQGMSVCVCVYSACVYVHSPKSTYPLLPHQHHTPHPSTPHPTLQTRQNTYISRYIPSCVPDRLRCHLNHPCHCAPHCCILSINQLTSRYGECRCIGQGRCADGQQCIVDCCDACGQCLGCLVDEVDLCVCVGGGV